MDMMDSAPTTVVSQHPSTLHIAPSQRRRWIDIFQHVDADGDGFITVDEAKVLFRRSGLVEVDLAKIWVLSDADLDHKLNRKEFEVAMLLIHARLRGEDIPDVLPIDLQMLFEETEQPNSKCMSSPQTPTPPALSQFFLTPVPQSLPSTSLPPSSLPQTLTSDVGALFAHANLPANELNWIWNVADNTKDLVLGMVECCVAMFSDICSFVESAFVCDGASFSFVFCDYGWHAFPFSTTTKTEAGTTKTRTYNNNPSNISNNKSCSSNNEIN